MNISAIAIKRPVFTVMLAVALLVLGIMGLKNLGTDLFPDVSMPVVTVNVPYPGAGPGEVETLVSKPIEEAVVGLNGIERVRSYSREGISMTVVQFKLGVDLADAATQVRERVAGIRYKLPNEVKEPTVQRFDVAAAPVLTYTLSSKRSLSEARKYAEDVLKPALEQVSGVAVVDVRGGAPREVQVALDHKKIQALGLDPLAVIERLRGANLDVPAGHVDEGNKEVSIRTTASLGTVDAIRDVIVANTADGSVVRLRDVARVEDGYADVVSIVRANGVDTVGFEIVKQSGSNTVAVADAVKARLALLEKDLPKEMAIAPIVDQSKYIRENAHEVETAIVFGGAMAILVILIFMLDLRSTLISAVALPTSVIGTFFVMYVLGYTLNMMTLLGLSLAIGLLIDDAVVVRENIFKHLEAGKSPAQAALDGTKEIALSVLATTLTIVAVFLPIAFVKGMVGQFFRQFGVTVSAAVILSLLVAFTLDPMLSARFSGKLAEKHDRFARLKRPFLAVFAAIERSYRGMLRFVVNHKALVGLASVASLVGMVFVAKLTGAEFMAAEDRGQFDVDIELPAGTSLAETSKLSFAAEERMRANPEVRTLFVTIAPGGSTNKATWRVITTGKNDRTVSLASVKDAARDIVKKLPGAKVSVTDPAFIEGGEKPVPIVLDIRGPKLDELEKTAQQVEEILTQTPGIQDVRVMYSPGRPEVRVEVDRLKAASYGVPAARVALALRAATEGDEAGKLRLGTEEVPIKVRLQKDDRSTIDALSQLTIQTPKGPVRLLDVARLVRADGPQVIEREDRNRQIQVWAVPRGRPLGDIVNEIKPRIDNLARPKGVSFMWDGQVKMMTETNGNMGVALLLGVLFIYIVLASQFESFVHPVTIMVTLPLALVGAIVALFVTGNTMAMGAIIGIILLMGLVTKNAILLVDRAIVRVRERGETPLEAILEAGPERLRPILMTSAAMVLGMLPTALGTGEGSEFRAPMAIAVIGGVISSTFLSLLVVPALYVAVENLKARLSRTTVRLSSAPRTLPNG